MKVTRAKIQEVCRKYPTLTIEGFSHFTPVGTRVKIFMENCDQIEDAVDFLTAMGGPQPKFCRVLESYKIKHIAEKSPYSRTGYISNGCLIVAAVLLGFKIELTKTPPNCVFNISRINLYKQRDATGE